MHQN